MALSFYFLIRLPFNLFDYTGMDFLKKLSFENALATFSQAGYPVATAVDGKVAPSSNGWAVFPQMGKTHYASFQVRQSCRFRRAY